MATIDIFPLSIDGIKAPLNLIANHFTQVNPEYLLYPIDLGSNPQYCHAVQFAVFDYETTGLDAIKAHIESMNASLKNKTIADLQIPSTQDFKIKVNKNNPRAYINLYMPDTVATSYDSDYTTISLTDTLGPLGFLSNALSDTKGGPGERVKQLMGNTELWQQILSKTTGAAAGGFLGMEAGNVSAFLQQKMGQIPNPQMQLIYRGIGLRQFQLEFIFTPISQKEAENVDQIIKAFTYYSLPEILAGNGGQYLAPPQVFSIKFAFLGGSSILSAISNVFKNTLMNVFDPEVTNLLLGTSPSSASNDIKTAADAKIFTVNDCVLTNVAIDHAPNGWATFTDGFPIQTRLTLQFQEMEMQTKADVKGKQYTSGDIASEFNFGNLFSK